MTLTKPTVGQSRGTWGAVLNAALDDLDANKLSVATDAATHPVVFNIGGYGAVGDGTTDVTAIIQARIDAAAAAGGGIVHVPRGTYVFTRLTLKTNVALVGADWRSSVLKVKAGTNADAIVLATVDTEGVSIRDLRIDGNKAGNSSGNTVVLDNTAGVFTYSDPYHLFQNVFVENSAGVGWKLTSGVRESRFLNCHSKLAYSHGFHVTGTDCFFTDCTSATSGQAGWFIDGGNNQFTSCKAFSSGYRMTVAGDTADGFYISSAPRNKLVACEAQDNQRYGFVVIGANSFSNMLVGCLADSNAVNAVSTFSGFIVDTPAARNHLTGCVSGNQHGTQDYGLILKSGATANEIDLKVDSQNLGEASYTGTAESDNNVRINGVGRRDTGEALATGQEVFSRRLINSAAVSAGATGKMVLTYFTARKSETVTQVRMMSGSPAAGTPTVIRIGLYTVAANGDLTLVASTPNDTALFASTFTTYTKAFSASYPMVAGQRYALGLCILAGTVPVVYGCSTSFAAEAIIAPRLGGTVASLSDLPSPSVAAASVQVTNAHLQPYAVLLP